jgi:hypothetical protein
LSLHVLLSLNSRCCIFPIDSNALHGCQYTTSVKANLLDEGLDGTLVSVGPTGSVRWITKNRFYAGSSMRCMAQLLRHFSLFLNSAHCRFHKTAAT